MHQSVVGLLNRNLRKVKYYKVVLTAPGKRARCPLFRYINSKGYRKHDLTDSTCFQKMKVYWIPEENKSEETLPINQQLLVVSQYYRFVKVPEPTNGMRTLSLWSQSHSKSLLRFTLELSGLGAVVLNNKYNVFLMPYV
jgi:hypothetical protein